MAAKKYSAGAIFLQVVPVFANVQRAIEAESKNIDRALGDQMEKSGDVAGRRAGKAASKGMNEELRKGSSEWERDFQQSVDRLNQKLGKVNANKLSNDMRRELAKVKRDLREIGDTDLTIDANVDNVKRKIAEIEAATQALRDKSKIAFKADFDDVIKGAAKARAAIEAVDGTIKIDVDTKPAIRAMGHFERSLKQSMEKAAKSIDGSANAAVQRLHKRLTDLGNLKVGVDISATRLHREVAQIMSELQGLSKASPEIDVRLDSGRAWAELQRWDAAVRRADGKTINTKVDVDTKKAQSSLFALTRSGDDSANTFRSFNAVLLAAVSAGPALIPILGAIAGGLLAVGPAAAVAGAGLGAVLIGFSGIGDALSALQSQDEQAAMTAQTSGRAQEAAARGVADARRSAARAVESALDQQRAAQERYADSIQDVKDAEEALRQAREEAKNTGADIKERISDNQLAQDQGLLDVFNATVTYNSVMADGSATNAEQEQARINMERAKDALEDLRREGKELAKEQKKWRQEGVNGTDEVQQAQDRLNDALDAQKDAYEAVGEAARAVDQARADGARQVADAIRAQGDAMESLNAQQNKVDQAFDKLGVSGQQFALFLYSLRDDFYAFRDDIQAVLLPAVQEAMQAFMGSESGAVLRDLMIDLAGSFGQFVKALSASFQGPAWLEFFQTLHDLGPDIQAAYGRAFISFLEAMASIMTTLAPYALDFANGLARMMDGFDRWAQSKDGQDAIESFMGYVEKVAPHVIEFFEAFGAALGNLLVALAPYAEQTLETLTRVLDYIANMDTDILAPIATAVLVLITGSQYAYGIVSTLIAAGTLFASTLGAIIAIAVILALSIGYLMKTNEGFRDFMVDAWDRIGGAVSDAWKRYLEPALSELWDAVKELWDEVLEPFFAWLGPTLVKFSEWYFPRMARVVGGVMRGIAWVIREILIPALRFIGPVMKWLVENIIVPYAKKMIKFWTAVGHTLKWQWEHIIHPAWKALAAAAKWLWNNALKPAFENIGDGWSNMVDSIKWVWNRVLKPVWDYITDRALPHLERGFQRTVDAIETIWDGLKKVVGAPIKFVLDTIINKGLIAGMNKVAGWVGMDDDHFKEVSIPKALQSYATGGIMPGYTPGRDVHQFVSPTAGRLELSGGEAIMRPEWTAAVGPDYVNQMNAIARSKGVNGIRQATGSYWMGGVLPLDFATSIKQHSGYEWVNWAGDLNSPYDLANPPSAVRAWKDGVVKHVFEGYGDSHGRYGNHVMMDHGAQTSLYAHLSSIVSGILGKSLSAGTMLGRVGETGNAFGAHLHFEVDGGAVDFGDSNSTGGHPKIPSWVKGLLKSPVDTIKGWMTDKWSQAPDLVTASPAFDVVKRVPLELAGGVKDKVMDMMPGWAKAAAGVIGKAGDVIGDVAGGVGDAISGGAGAVGDALGLADGGILPYNGTMMYDNGGYLPPGMTTVVNLTGKPEPVFTNDQWADVAGGGQGGNIHYEPHFEGSDLRPEDVAADLNFTFRRIKRGGVYEGVGS